ncbi:MAG: radical SAM family heme chaperone HemW [Verrucomicrobia bacterium]|nr:radical SAM family heme chaperone HemW [Verrucomicrobiota bacterium]
MSGTRTRVRHVYVHVPFCHRICPYCGFYKHQPGKTSYETFAGALTNELRFALRDCEVVPRTLYFGGGTPSILPGNVWRGLVEGMGREVDLSGLEEWNLEANPRTFDEAKAAVWVETGVTRVSLGVQAFDEGSLQVLGRDHGPEDVAEAVNALRRAGIREVNIDLMFSVPGQRLADWERSLHAALDLAPDHLSTYNLTYEEDTEFLQRYESGEWTADADRDAEFFLLADRLLGEAGWVHYEVSNFARPGHESVHNRAYWAGADYLGLGPSAVSTIGGARWRNLPDTVRWVGQIQGVGHARLDGESLSEIQLGMERMALLLRTSEGVPRSWVEEDLAENLIGEGLAEWRDASFVLTTGGMMVADEIAAYLC